MLIGIDYPILKWALSARANQISPEQLHQWAVPYASSIMNPIYAIVITARYGRD